MEISLENHINCCRCCSILLQASHKTVRISKSIEKRFFELSGVKLIMTEDFSSVICESCNSKLSEFSDFRNEICEYQAKLISYVQQNQLSHENEQLMIEEEHIEEDNIIQIKVEQPYDIQHQVLTYEEHPVEELQSFHEVPEVKPEKFCNLCNKHFPARSFYYHNMRKHNPIEFVCDIDGKSFSVKHDLREHMKIHVKAREKFYCKTCNAPFLSTTALKHHENFFHSEYIEEHPCDKCSKIFASRMKLLQHRSNVHKQESFKCPGCEKVYQTTGALKKHMNMHHSNKEHCNICQKLVAPGIAMKNHLKTHSKPTIKCTFEGCEREFHSKRAYDDHMEGHVAKDPVICPECNAPFPTTQKLQRHQKRQHINARAYCEVAGCHHASTRKDYLMKHYASHREIDEGTRQILINRVKLLKTIPW